MPRMSIVEDSYYDHDEHGRVKVADVTNGVVTMEKQNDHFISGGTRFPSMAQQSAAGFQDEAEPADLHITAQPAVFDLNGVNQ